jgi:hypothetical protein
MAHSPQWMRRVREAVLPIDGEILRDVTIEIDSASFANPADTGNYVILLRPGKGVHSDLSIDRSHTTVKCRILTHGEHLQVARGLIYLKVISVYQSLDVSNTAGKIRLSQMSRKLRHVNKVVSDSPERARKRLVRSLDSDVFREVERGQGKFGPAAQLRQLCEELAQRYYVIAFVQSKSSDFPDMLSYSYSEQMESRPYRRFHRLRSLFRAPTSAFRIHVPLARQSDHYEFAMSSIDGYYVYEQRVLQDDREVPKSTYEKYEKIGRPFWRNYGESPLRNVRHNGVEISRDNGRIVSPRVFIGNASVLQKRIYVGIRYFEIPPGATGIALLTTLMSLLVALGLTLWTVGQSSEPTTNPSAALLCALVGLGAAGIERVLPKSEVLNAPYVPRLVLFLQSLGLLLLSIWLLAHGTPLPDSAPWSWWIVQVSDQVLYRYFAIVTIGGLAIAFIYLVTRFLRMLQTYESQVETSQKGSRNVSRH